MVNPAFVIAGIVASIGLLFVLVVVLQKRAAAGRPNISQSTMDTFGRIMGFVMGARAAYELGTGASLGVAIVEWALLGLAFLMVVAPEVRAITMHLRKPRGAAP